MLVGSRYSDGLRGWNTDKSGFGSRQGQEILLFSATSNGWRSRSVNLTTRLYLVSRLKIQMELYLHSAIRLQSVVLNWTQQVHVYGKRTLLRASREQGMRPWRQRRSTLAAFLFYSTEMIIRVRNANILCRQFVCSGCLTIYVCLFSLRLDYSAHYPYSK
jgi:hypothetical protein